MTTLSFSVTINAPKEIVWDKLWSDAGYRQWTSAFMQGSYAESDWEEGSKIRFLSPSGEGMYSIIEKKLPFEEMTFKHQGEIKNGVEEPKDWAGAIESYQLKEANGITELNVRVDTTEDFLGYMQETFPKALDILKQISEQQSELTAR
jgi:hypothetical protein